MAIVVFGNRPYGVVDEFEHSHVATQMMHCYFMPLVPERGVLTFHDAHRAPHSVYVPIDVRSVAATYLRWYWWTALVGACALVPVTPDEWRWLPVLGGFALAALLFAIGKAIGAVTPLQRRQRHLYQQLTHVAADPAHLVHAIPGLRAEVHRTLAAYGKRLDFRTYRTGHDPELDWSAIALEPELKDAAYLCGALTLARLEYGAAKGARRRAIGDAHDAIFSKLESSRSHDAAIDWSTWEETAAALDETKRRDDAERAARAPAPSPPWTPIAPATDRGRTFEDGWDVAIGPRDYAPPPACASCGQLPERRIPTTKGGLTLEIPYCAPCFYSSMNGWNSNRGRLLQLGLITLPCAFAVLGLVRGLPLWLAIAGTAALSVGGGIAFVTRFALTKRPLPATATLDAARLIAVDAERATLFCTHQAWAEDLARVHGGEPVAAKRPNRSLQRLVPYSLLAAPALAGYVWFMANPSLHIDNGLHAPLQIWVDGDRSIIVPPSTAKEHGEASTLRLPRGHHVLGWSAVGAAAPALERPVDIALAGQHLYSPGAVLCHFVDITLYGTPGHAPGAGPLPPDEFYTFARVDNWFADNPSSIKGKTGEARIAVKRFEGCEYLTSPPCPDDERARFWACAATHWFDADDSGVMACEKSSAARCGLTSER